MMVKKRLNRYGSGGYLKVSIIMPSYNSAQTISASIDSVLRQSFKDWELVIVDDNSTDETVSIVVENCSRESPKIHLLTNSKNVGAAKARNKGIDFASGRYIAFLDSDDSWYPEKLERQLCFMKKMEIDFCFSAYVINDGNHQKEYKVPVSVRRNDLLKKNSICTSTVIYDSSRISKIRFPDIPKGQDLALWLNILKVTDHAFSIKNALTVYNKGSDTLSANKIESARWVWKLYRDVERMRLVVAMYFFIHYAINGFRKHWIGK